MTVVTVEKRRTFSRHHSPAAPSTYVTATWITDDHLDRSPDRRSPLAPRRISVVSAQIR